MTTRDEITDCYEGYIACLNSQNWPKLGHFVHDELQDAAVTVITEAVESILVPQPVGSPRIEAHLLETLPVLVG